MAVLDNLAQEVVDELIDALHGIDPNSMKACGLVCTRWLARSRYNLFSRVFISAKTIRSFFELVDVSPVPILTFVRHLCLVYDGNPQWLRNLGRLHQCANICALELDVAARVHDLEPLRSHISSWAQSGFVSELTLIGPNMKLPAVRDILSWVPSVKSLHLRIARTMPFQPISSLPPPLPLTLHALTLGPKDDGGSDFFAWLLSFLVVPRLKSIQNLGAVQLGRHQETVERYFVCAGGVLQSLTFNLRLNSASDRDISECYGKILPHTPNLRHISLCFRNPESRSVLDTLALLHLPHLESMVITWGYGYAADSLQWGDLDEALADPRFRNLRHFFVNLSGRDGVEVSAITRWTQSVMPLAFARGLLGPRIPNPALVRRRQRGTKMAKLGRAV
ncbi:hypothetical protein DFH08DRAFT_163348 [Mycena albidolilacea]|uniref:Uncharacterized protein n=1 Tax=Mycena albidolilacea TaxID=1033008 RepID=A0AAD7AQF4_9AGAR|nr:hypothetical protein DFH08DRAFT_163348 [Mycena albidolilacea]